DPERVGGGVSEAPSVHGSAPADVAGALTELAQAREASYYDADADAKARDAYYRDIDLNAPPEALGPALSVLVRRTHATELPYKPQLHLYPVVDLQPDGEIRSVYTGELDRPEELILDHARTDAERAARVEERVASDPSSGADRTRHEVEVEVEVELPYNCEHVVPQSWFK